MPSNRRYAHSAAPLKNSSIRKAKQAQPTGRIGLIFLMPLAGAALGAASGAVSGALTDLGISNKFMKETAAAIQPGTAALFVLVRKVTADKVLEGLKGEGGTVLKTSLDHTKEAALQAALAGVQSAVPAPPS